MAKIFYECVKCGQVASKEDWERGQTKLEEWEQREREKRGLPITSEGFKCPYCSYRVARKRKPPIVKSLHAI